MGRVVVAMAWLVVAVCEDSQVALGLRRCQLGLRAGIVEGLSAGIELQVNALLRSSAQAFPA